MLCFILFFASFCFELSGAEPIILNFAIGEYSPSISESLPGYGFMTQIVTAAFKAEGIEVNYCFCPWERVWNNLIYGVSDGSLGYLWTKEREEIVLYSDVIWDHSYSAAFYLRKSRFSIQRPEDLTGMVVVIQRGYSYGSIVDEMIRSGEVKSIIVESDEQAFKLVILKRADIFLTNNLNGLYMLRKLYPGEDLFACGDYDPGEQNDSFYMIITRKNPQALFLIRRFNSGLKKIRKSGQYALITANYTAP